MYMQYTQLITINNVTMAFLQTAAAFSSSFRLRSCLSSRSRSLKSLYSRPVSSFNSYKNTNIYLVLVGRKGVLQNMYLLLNKHAFIAQSNGHMYPNLFLKQLSRILRSNEAGYILWWICKLPRATNIINRKHPSKKLEENLFLNTHNNAITLIN